LGGDIIALIGIRRRKTMARRIIDGVEYTIPDAIYSGRKLQEYAGIDYTVPVVLKPDKDIVVAPDEEIALEHNDTVVYVTPMEAA
jgi:hypothetical protein